jgi:tetratricopeptide (TPR) repeat protein
MPRNLAPRIAAAVALATAFPLATHAAAQGTVASASAMVRAGRFDDARRALSAWVRAHPTDGAAQLWLGRAYLGEDSTDAAVASLEKAAERLKSAEGYMELAHAYGAQAGGANPLTQPLVTRKVRNALQSAVAAEPRNVKARLGLMQFQLATPWLYGGSRADADSQVVALTRISPYYGGLGRAVIQANTDDMAGAEATLNSLARQYPDSAGPVSMLTKVYQQRREADKAWAALDAFTARNPRNRRILFDVGGIALATGQRLDVGERALTAYLAGPLNDDMPPAPIARLQLGQIYEKEGKRDLARAQYQQALAVDPHLIPARAALNALDHPPVAH